MSTTIVVSVPTLASRDVMLTKIYTNLTKEPSIEFSVTRTTNTVELYHTVDKDTKILIRTYIVIIIPMSVDLSPLYGFGGSIHYHLDYTIQFLESLLRELHAFQGYQIRNGESLNAARKRLAEGLYGATGKY